MTSTAAARRTSPVDLPLGVFTGAAGFLHFLLVSPSWFYFLTLSLMLFRPPGLQFFHVDRIAFLLLVLFAILRALAFESTLPLGGPVTWPLLGLLTLASWDVLSLPYQSEAWAGLVTRWVVPFSFFCIAQLVFSRADDREQVETFCLIILAYLAIIAIFFLVGLHSLIFPRFVMDETLGIHADRARGPFLQAVANGVTLNLLGLIALNAFRRGRLRGGIAFLLLVSLPIAILATRTRSVWLSFSLTILVVPLVSHSRRLRQACLALIAVSVLAVLLGYSFSHADIANRLAEESPIEFRASVFQAGWEMFLERPVLGWTASQIQPQLLQRVSDFHSDGFAFHNNYLDIAVSHGTLGLLLYLWLYFDLFRLGKTLPPSSRTGFADMGFRRLWPVLVSVYALNACFVLMQYQFVNALLFTFAGILAAENRKTVAPVCGPQ